MEYFEDAKKLIIHSKEMIVKIENSYIESLNEKEIKISLIIEIKNLMENIRSSLDFCANGLFYKYGSSNKNYNNIYFPYAQIKYSKVEFQRERTIEKKIPGIQSKPEIVKILESYQHFESQKNKWLPTFMELNNENKHLKLSPQTKEDQKQLILVSGRNVLPLGVGGKITLGKGAKFQIGNTIIEGEQTFDANNPPRMKNGGYSIVKSWTSIHFTKNKIEVLPFLKNAIIETEKIVEELSKV